MFTRFKRSYEDNNESKAAIVVCHYTPTQTHTHALSVSRSLALPLWLAIAAKTLPTFVRSGGLSPNTFAAQHTKATVLLVVVVIVVVFRH